MKRLTKNDKQKAMETATTDFDERGEDFLKFVREFQLKAEKNGLTADKLNEILYAKS